LRYLWYFKNTISKSASKQRSINAVGYLKNVKVSTQK
jgi:hypothetical protein